MRIKIFYSFYKDYLKKNLFNNEIKKNLPLIKEFIKLTKIKNIYEKVGDILFKNKNESFITLYLKTIKFLLNNEITKR